ncbi:unnamed protein product, partial [Nesidiocoris tenuis]
MNLPGCYEYFVTINLHLKVDLQGYLISPQVYVRFNPQSTLSRSKPVSRSLEIVSIDGLKFGARPYTVM